MTDKYISQSSSLGQNQQIEFDDFRFYGSAEFHEIKEHFGLIVTNVICVARIITNAIAWVRSEGKQDYKYFRIPTITGSETVSEIWPHSILDDCLI